MEEEVDRVEPSSSATKTPMVTRFAKAVEKLSISTIF